MIGTSVFRKPQGKSNTRNRLWKSCFYELQAKIQTEKITERDPVGKNKKTWLRTDIFPLKIFIIGQR